MFQWPQPTGGGLTETLYCAHAPHLYQHFTAERYILSVPKSSQVTLRLFLALWHETAFNRHILWTYYSAMHFSEWMQYMYMAFLICKAHFHTIYIPQHIHKCIWILTSSFINIMCIDNGIFVLFNMPCILITLLFISLQAGVGNVCNSESKPNIGSHQPEKTHSLFPWLLSKPLPQNTFTVLQA